jgi:segregation and condensation protein A
VTIVNNTAAVESALLHGYQLRLPAYEGPFDVLLRLVERSQLEITDISLVTVTRQFLDYVSSLESQEPRLLAEFSAVGSRLIVLKSRSLLPKPSIEDDEPIGDLARELIEYRAVREMAGQLAAWDRRGAGAFMVQPGNIPAASATDLPPLAHHRPTQLVHALRRRLTVTPAPALLVAARKLVSLRDMAHLVLSVLHVNGTGTFRAVAARCADLHETRAAFLALLVLARRQVLEVDQRELFGEITFRPAPATVLNDSFLHGISFDEKVTTSAAAAD